VVRLVGIGKTHFLGRGVGEDPAQAWISNERNHIDVNEKGIGQVAQCREKL